MIQILEGSVEFQKWGWIMFVTVFGTTFFSILSFWALWEQNKRIWSSESGEGASVRWFSYYPFFFIAMTIYGFHIKSIATILSASVSAIIYVFIVVGLWKFKKWSDTERKMFFLFILMPPIMMLPWKDAILFAFGIGVIYSIATQVWELLKGGRVGVLDIRLIVVKFISVIFWTVHAFLVGAVALQLINPFVIFLFSAIIILYYLCIVLELLHETLEIQGLD